MKNQKEERKKSESIDYYSDDDDTPEKPKKKTKMSQFKGGVKNLFGLSKKEENERKKMSSSSKKLPKNFANMILDYEMQIDSGTFDIEIIDKLMQLYSVSYVILQLFQIHFYKEIIPNHHYCVSLYQL